MPREGETVLDTCMGGLGYTAIEASKRGGAYVITIEIDPQRH